MSGTGKRTWWFIAGVFSLIATVAAVYEIPWTRADSKTGPVEIKTKPFEIKTRTRKDCSLAPWLATEKLGYFEQEGIKLTYTGETQPALWIPSLLRGDNDVDSGHPNTFGVAIAGGAQLTGVVRGGIDPSEDVDPKFRHMWWFVNPARYPNVKSFADLKDIPGTLKFSTITSNICTDFLTNKLADKYGIPRDKFEWVTMPDIQAIQALKQGLVDVAGQSIRHFIKGWRTPTQ